LRAKVTGDAAQTRDTTIQHWRSAGGIKDNADEGEESTCLFRLGLQRPAAAVMDARLWHRCPWES